MNLQTINRIVATAFTFIITVFALVSQTVTPWLTSGDKTRLLQQQSTFSFGANTGAASVVVTVNPANNYQAIDGFGFCMTEGSAEVISSMA
ncbi:MAG TPA: hypothetical protein VI413_12310, partial [Paludibacter sp.]